MWYEVGNRDDFRERDISGDVETEGIGRTVTIFIDNLKYVVKTYIT